MSELGLNKSVMQCRSFFLLCSDQEAAIHNMCLHFASVKVLVLLTNESADGPLPGFAPAQEECVHVKGKEEE